LIMPLFVKKRQFVIIFGIVNAVVLDLFCVVCRVGRGLSVAI
jgi:hypothetical protein